jgi:hypothetical protein
MLFLQVCILLEFLDDGVLKVVTVRIYCIYQVSFFGGFLHITLSGSIAVDSLGSYYGSSIVQLEFCKMDCGSYL